MKNRVLTFWLVSIGFAVVYAYVQNKREDSRVEDLIAQAGGRLEELPIMGQVTAFDLELSNGNKITAQDMLGKVWVASLMYADCKGPCPLMAHNFSRLQKFFETIDNFRLLSVSIDSSDSSEILNEYRNSYAGMENIWYFAKFDMQKTQAFSEMMKLPLNIEEKTHSTRFVLIDQKGQIRGYYNSQKKPGMESLRFSISQLLQEDLVEGN